MSDSASKIFRRFRMLSSTRPTAVSHEPNDEVHRQDTAVDPPLPPTVVSHEPDDKVHRRDFAVNPPLTPVLSQLTSGLSAAERHCTDIDSRLDEAERAQDDEDLHQKAKEAMHALKQFLDVHLAMHRASRGMPSMNDDGSVNPNLRLPAPTTASEAKETISRLGGPPESFESLLRLHRFASGAYCDIYDSNIDYFMPRVSQVLREPYSPQVDLCRSLWECSSECMDTVLAFSQDLQSLVKPNSEWLPLPKIISDLAEGTLQQQKGEKAWRVNGWLFRGSSDSERWPSDGGSSS